MNPDSTANQRLAGVLLERPLAEYVIEKRECTPKWPWRLIATQLNIDTNGQVNVSHETLRQWFASEDDAA